jgi:hypothetical protein
VFCLVLVDVGEDEGAPGTVGEAWGGVNRRRQAAGTGGSDLEIPARERVIGLASDVGRLSGERGGDCVKRLGSELLYL